MSKEKLDFKNGSLFPWHFQVFAVVLVIGSIASFPSNIVLALILLFISVLMLTSYSGISINKSQKEYKEYNSFLFIKVGKVKNYDEVEKIFINGNNVSQKVYTAHTLNSRTFKNVVYDGYLKFTDGTKIHITSSNNKDKLLNQLQKLSDFLSTKIIDNTLSD